MTTGNTHIQDDTTEAGLAELIRSYCAASGMALTTFGTYAVRDGRLVQRLDQGGTVSLKTRRTILKFIQDHPANAAPPVAAE